MKLKIFSYSVVVILLSSSQLFAQDSDGGAKIEFGLQNSVNLTQLIGSSGSIEYINRTVEYEMAASRLSFDVGLFANIHVSDLLAIQPEIVYSIMGAHFHEKTSILHDLGIFEGSESISFALDYVKFNLPINIKFNEQLYFQTGAYCGVLLSAESFNPWWQFNFDTERTSLSDMNRFDVGIMGGMGFSTKIVNLTFRYNYGLLNVFGEEDYEELDYKNGVLQLVAHWKIHSDLR